MPITLDVRDLLGSVGATRDVRVRERVGGLATELASVPEDRDIVGSLRLESLVEGLFATGTLEGSMQLVCARCLTTRTSPFSVEAHELFAPGATGEDEAYPVSDGAVDLEPLLRDVILLAMPFAPLCRPGCLGLCERCGGDRNLNECTCAVEPDPRWAALEHARTD
jgi:uncharacterized protein